MNTSFVVAPDKLIQDRIGYMLSNSHIVLSQPSEIISNGEIMHKVQFTNPSSEFKNYLAANGANTTNGRVYTQYILLSPKNAARLINSIRK